jgi:transcriptional regulator with XRE-family HTH domain
VQRKIAFRRKALLNKFGGYAQNIVSAKKRTRLGQLLEQRGISAQELADAIGCSPRSIHNESSKPKSLALRRKITAFLGVQVWDDVPICGIIHTFGLDNWLEFIDSKTARAWARRFNKLQPGVAEARRREVRYRAPITVMLSLVRPQTCKNLISPSANEIRFNRTCEIAVNLPPRQIPPGTKLLVPARRFPNT